MSMEVDAAVPLPWRVFYRYSIRCPWLRLHKCRTQAEGEELLRIAFRARMPSPPAQGYVLPRGVHPDQLQVLHGAQRLSVEGAAGVDEGRGS